LILNGFEPTSWFYRAIDRYFDDFPHASSLNIPWAPLLEHLFWSTVFLGLHFLSGPFLFRPDFTLRPAQFARLPCSILFPSSRRFHLYGYGLCGGSLQQYRSSIWFACRQGKRTLDQNPVPIAPSYSRFRSESPRTNPGKQIDACILSSLRFALARLLRRRREPSTL
jgi:hypothetical protein